MKQTIPVLALAMSLIACNKETQPETLAPGGQVNQERTSTPAINARSFSVATEADLKSKVANALPGDIITITANIRLTSTLELKNSGTAAAKINLTGAAPNTHWTVRAFARQLNGALR